MRACKLYILISITSLYQLQGQTITYKATFSNTPLIEVLDSLENQSSKEFFFAEGWVENIYVNVSYNDDSLQSVLIEVLRNSNLSFIEYDEKIILSKNLTIKDTLPDNFLGKNTKNEQPSNFFDRDFEEQQENENQPIEVGNRDNPIKDEFSIISGRVLDESDTPLTGAIVYTIDRSVSATTNQNGEYQIRVRTGKVTLLAQYIGMEESPKELIVFSNGNLNFSLNEKVITLEELVVESNRDQNIRDIHMGLSRIDVTILEKMPRVLGEADLFKIVTTMPGVQSAGEGTPGIYVRGGGADQNLILIDGAPVYNTSHFLGFFSVFNSNALASSELYKSSLPSKFGGRLSSVLDISSRSASASDFEVNAGISPITSHLEVDIPVIENKFSILVAGRSTYSDWILQRIPDSNIKNSDPRFYDLMLKFYAQISERDQLSLTAYQSEDRFKLTLDSAFSYRNQILSANWIHTFSEKLKLNLTTYRSDYVYKIEFDSRPEDAFQFDFAQRETGLKLDFNYLLNDKHKLNAGVDVKGYRTNPGEINPLTFESLTDTRAAEKESGIETAFYLSDNWDLSPKLGVELGIRYSIFTLLGPDTYSRYIEGLPRSQVTQTSLVEVPPGSISKIYHGPEFRWSGRYAIDASNSIKASIGSTRQYIHQLSNTVAISPTDTWKLSDFHIKPQTAIQYSLGYYKNFAFSDIETSIEGYYKTLNNLLDFKIGADLVANESVETDIVQGEGRSYGLEFFVRKKSGRLNGWISYSWLRSFLKVDSEFQSERINNGEYFPSNYDQPHNFNLVGNYDISKRYSLTSNINFSSGRPVTFPTGQYAVQGVPTIDYSDRNEFRIPDYFRWDIAFNIEGNHKIKKLAHSSWTISIYNVLGRDNVFSVFFERDEQNLESFKLIIFGDPIPSITYNLRF